LFYTKPETTTVSHKSTSFFGFMATFLEYKLMQQPTRSFTVFLLVLIFLSACQSDFFYEQAVPIPENTWTYADTASFTVPVSDTTERYNLYLDIAHTTDYPFENMYVRVHTNFPSGKRLSEQVNIDMADKAGVWHGNCQGENCQLRVHLQRNAYFNELGDYEITFEQYMRVDSLAGIKELAFRMERVED